MPNFRRSPSTPISAIPRSASAEPPSGTLLRTILAFDVPGPVWVIVIWTVAENGAAIGPPAGAGDVVELGRRYKRHRTLKVNPIVAVDSVGNGAVAIINYRASRLETGQGSISHETYTSGRRPEARLAEKDFKNSCSDGEGLRVERELGHGDRANYRIGEPGRDVEEEGPVGTNEPNGSNWMGNPSPAPLSVTIKGARPPGPSSRVRVATACADGMLASTRAPRASMVEVFLSVIIGLFWLDSILGRLSETPLVMPIPSARCVPAFRV